MPPVEPLCVPQRNVLHDPGQGELADLDLQVNMVGHQTKGVHPEPKSLVRFLENLVETIPVLVI